MALNTALLWSVIKEDSGLYSMAEGEEGNTWGLGGG